MSRSRQRSLTHEEASILLQCGSFWPDSMVDESSFMKMLLGVLNVEAETDIQIARWEEELAASEACNACGVVDVRHYVSRVLAKSKLEDEMLVATRFVVSHGAEWELPAPSEPSKEMLAATYTKQGGPYHPER
eukprot:4862190-Amphidinium_carterae.1